jgi:MFS family permease
VLFAFPQLLADYEQHSAPGVGQIFGGLLSFAFQAIPKSSPINGWRLMFITLGALTVIVGICILLFLPDTPMDAKFLSDEEKVAVLRHVSINMTGVSNRKPHPREILEALKDLQIWLLIFPGILASMSSGLTGTYSTSSSLRVHVSSFTDRNKL